MSQHLAGLRELRRQGVHFADAAGFEHARHRAPRRRGGEQADADGFEHADLGPAVDQLDEFAQRHPPHTHRHGDGQPLLGGVGEAIAEHEDGEHVRHPGLRPLGPGPLPGAHQHRPGTVRELDDGFVLESGGQAQPGPRHHPVERLDHVRIGNPRRPVRLRRRTHGRYGSLQRGAGVVGIGQRSAVDQRFTEGGPRFLVGERHGGASRARPPRGGLVAGGEPEAGHGRHDAGDGPAPHGGSIAREALC